MKKVIISFLALLLVAVSFTACGTSSSKDDGKLQIVATIAPAYDWVQQLLGEKAVDTDLTLLTDNGVDLHSYQPTAEDILKISTCDIFIYVGGESDTWVADALKNVKNDQMIVINLMEALGENIKEEELVEGMEDDHGHEHEEEAIIKDRPLSDFVGEWLTLENSFKSGALDDYLKEQAEENDSDFNSQKDAFGKRIKSDYEKLTITQDGITFGRENSPYSYIGYQVVEGEHGDSVWYGFKADTNKKGIPAYIAFNDHHTESEEEDHEHEELEHFHFRYGDESFDALVAMYDWAPLYFPGDASEEAIAEAMSEHGHSHEGEYDEHVWLSLKNAEYLTTYIAEKLMTADAENKGVYEANLKTYHEELATLDSEYQDIVDKAANKTLLFGDRFPFRYLVDDYGLTYYAAFVGCSTETDASFDTIIFLANKTDELKLKNVMVIENSDQEIAKSIVQNTKDKNQQVLVLDSMQSVTSKDIASGKTYLATMESNLDVLKEALK